MKKRMISMITAAAMLAAIVPAAWAQSEDSSSPEAYMNEDIAVNDVNDTL